MARFETTIHPGELFFGSGGGGVQTLLGSCVAATFWHPERKLGGICHYILPERLEQPPITPDGRYGAEALFLIHKSVLGQGTAPAEYVVRVFGGGSMFRRDDRVPAVSRNGLIGNKNVLFGRRLLGELGFVVSSEDVGGDRYRVVRLDLVSGEVTVRYGAPDAAEARRG
jgi:chemotaxis protein CheD